LTSKVFSIQDGESSYPFYVQADGTLHATKANITGTVTAESGAIGRWHILQGTTGTYNWGAICNNDTLNANATVGMMFGDYWRISSSATRPDKCYRFWAGGRIDGSSTPPFYVLHDGTLHATKADIEGKIVANSGSFTGNIVANALTISSGVRIGGDFIV